MKVTGQVYKTFEKHMHNTFDKAGVKGKDLSERTLWNLFFYMKASLDPGQYYDGWLIKYGPSTDHDPEFLELWNGLGLKSDHIDTALRKSLSTYEVKL